METNGAPESHASEPVSEWTKAFTGDTQGSAQAPFVTVERLQDPLFVASIVAFTENPAFPGRLTPADAVYAETMRDGEAAATIAQILGKKALDQEPPAPQDEAEIKKGPQYKKPRKTAAEKSPASSLQSLIPKKDLRAALCRYEDPDLFFATDEKSVEFAKEICRRCPVIQACLEEALEADVKFGIWGGHTATERRRLRNRQGRQAS